MPVVDFSLGSSGWAVAENGARVKVSAGKTIRMRVLDLTARTAAVDITAGEPRMQRLAYVLRGHATITSGAVKRQLDPEMYVEVAPSAGSVILSSVSGETSIVAVFEPLSR